MGRVVTSDAPPPGPVTGLCDAQVDERCGEMGEAHPALARLVAPECDAAPVLQLREQVLDVVAAGVDRLIPGRWVHHAKLWWGMDSAAIGCERGAQLGRHVAAVEGYVTSQDARDESRRGAQVGVLAGAWHEPQDAARAARAGMELGAQAAAAAPQALRPGVAARGTRGGALRLACGAVQQAPARPRAGPGAAPRTPGPTSRAPTSAGSGW